ncbi:glycosyltransferase [Arthrobacter sp. Marseille-P9274]|uniref:glycosyltransferase n=1 Tax=Arthrobacter sp. Marseille-P9274 TaxID=2866572 RepID=UPI0021C6546E|nr:glycosyltransferase [Arthrobacter sp. Marseille-P9274]
MIILIPAFEPDRKLITLVAGLRAADRRLTVLVVDDGSGPDFAPVFAAARSAGATVIGYPRNRGKGQALKTGFDYVARHHPDRGVVCADSDGQHAISDILRSRSERSKSLCPDESCCRRPPADLAAQWGGQAWPAARANTHLLAALPPGAFPGVDETEVYQFLQAHAAR